MKTLITILFFLTLVVIYIVLYLANKKTPLPEGCEDVRADCEGCHDFGCTNHPAHYSKKENQL